MTTRDVFIQLQRQLEEIRHILFEQNDTVLGVEGVMELTGLSRQTIYQKTCERNGQAPELPHFKKGNRLYFRRSEVMRWMTTDRVKTQQEIETNAATYNMNKGMEKKR